MVGDFGGGRCSGVRHPCSPAGTAQLGKGQVTTRHGRRGARALSKHDLGVPAARARGPTSAVSTCRHPAWPGTTPMRPPTESTWASARSSRSSTQTVARLGDRPGRATAPGGPPGQETLRKLFTERFASRHATSGRDLRRDRRLCQRREDLAEAESDEHITARGALITIDGVAQHAPAPRFSRTPPATPTPPPADRPDRRRLGQTSVAGLAFALWCGEAAPKR